MLLYQLIPPHNTYDHTFSPDLKPISFSNSKQLSKDYRQQSPINRLTHHKQRQSPSQISSSNDIKLISLPFDISNGSLFVCESAYANPVERTLDEFLSRSLLFILLGGFSLINNGNFLILGATSYDRFFSCHLCSFNCNQPI